MVKALKLFAVVVMSYLRTKNQYIYYDELTLWVDAFKKVPELYEVETNLPAMPSPNNDSGKSNLHNIVIIAKK